MVFRGLTSLQRKNNVLPFGLKIRSYFWAESLGKVMKFEVHGLCLEVLTSYFLNSDLKKYICLNQEPSCLNMFLVAT